MPKRFDTFFYVVHAPANQVAACDGHETVDAEWIAPRDVLRLAGSGERTVIFPTRINVQLLSAARDESDCLRGSEAVLHGQRAPGERHHPGPRKARENGTG